MVTARSIDVLFGLNIDKSDCLEMPELEEEDAKYLFLQSLGVQLQSINDDDEQRILQCVRHCQFHKGANMDKHFHPLALKVLGAQLGSLGLDPKMWVENLCKGDKFNRFGERVHPIFSVLRRGYDSLLKENQLLFMDSILFYPRPNRISQYYWMYSRPSGNWRAAYLNIFEWLSIVHKTEVWSIKDRLHCLKAKSLLEDIGDGLNGVSVHDLYLEFVKLEVRRGDLRTRRWVWFDEDVSYPMDLVMEPSGRCWKKLERVLVKYDSDPHNTCIQWRGSLEGMKWQHFSNVGVLHLRIGTNEVLDLRGLRVLRSLDVQWGDNNSYYFNSGREGKLIGLGQLVNLGCLHLKNIHYVPCIEEIGCLTLLEILWLEINCGLDWGPCCRKEGLSSLRLDKCINLRVLVLKGCNCWKLFPDLSKLRLLKTVAFEACSSVEEVVGLTSQMSALQELLLIFCDSLSHILGLGDVVSLQELCVADCKTPLELPSFHKLTDLQRLAIEGEFHEVVGFSEAMPLSELVVSGIVHLPDVHLLRNLQRFDLKSCCGSMLPQLSGLTALEELNLSNIPEVPELPDIHELSMLRRFKVGDAYKLEVQLPMLGDLVALEVLELIKCCTLVGKVELLDLQRLTNLQVLDLTRTPIKSLQGLERLIQLKILRCNETQLAELPNLRNLKLLESIDLSGCQELTSMGNLANLPVLEYINLSGCHELTSLDNLIDLPALKRLYITCCFSIQRLPRLKSFKKLGILDLCYSGIRLSLEDIMVLASISYSKVFICDHFKLDISGILKKMPLIEMVMKIEAKQLEFYATTWTKDLHITHIRYH